MNGEDITVMYLGYNQSVNIKEEASIGYSIAYTNCQLSVNPVSSYLHSASLLFSA
jgi:hypothetical protein